MNIEKTVAIFAVAMLMLSPSSFAFAANNNGNQGNNPPQVGGEHDDRDDDRDERDDKNDKDDKNGKGGYGGGQITKVEVCRATGSKWLPYVKVTVPTHVAEAWLDANPPKAVEVGSDGKCPKPEKTIREYVRERLSSIFDRFPFLARR